ncbi:MAG: hypothetical protein EAZ89_12335 [Bacteroidetes bacterium]|nr:MAG: hypothetical protein EAZ89_12335 [Bacteroidota bacterium]
MKGIVFTEFLEMVEDRFGFDIADNIISQSDLPSGGIYTAVGTYDHQEMVRLVVNLSAMSGIAVPDLLKAYGEHLFSRFVKGYHHFFANATSTLDFLALIENYIHVEVRKLYPDAELPTFETVRPAENRLEMTYHSSRGLGDFAEGLLNGCIKHFQENISLHREDINPDRTIVKFTLIRIPD